MRLRYAAAVLFCASVQAQDARTPVPYNVQFTIQDATDANAKSGRVYTTQLDNVNSRGVIRTGTKVPYQTGTGQVNYADIGVSIDSRLNEREGHLTLYTSVDLSSLVERSPTPVISQMRAETTTVVTPGRQVPVLTIDDPVLQRKVRVDALVTAVK